MEKNWIDLCRTRNLPFLDELPSNAMITEAGYILVKDSNGSILPLSSFDKCDNDRKIAVFPCHTLNTADKEKILAVASGLASEWNGTGVLTFSFACQTDGWEYALLNVTEGLCDVARGCFELRGVSGEELLESIESGKPLANFGAFLGLTATGACCRGKLYKAIGVKKVLKAMPSECRENLSPWYARLAEGGD
ncbi:MAG: hypothetical protein FWH04_10180 [Oscillospiraceae bacterium]|nr:hypothetical protein [Oscillospiraceae bacterium]